MLEDKANPTCGSCSFLGTANTMCCLAEAMGLSLPGSATIPATFSDRLRVAQESGRQIVELFKQGISALQILNKKGIENGIRVNAAIGGSTNAALHIPAIGYEADYDVSMDLFEELCRDTPHVAKMNPAAAPNVPDFHKAGGVPAVMKELLPLLHGDAMTVTGKSVAENVSEAKTLDSNIIRTLDDGGICGLIINYAPQVPTGHRAKGGKVAGCLKHLVRLGQGG